MKTKIYIIICVISLASVFAQANEETTKNWLKFSAQCQNANQILLASNGGEKGKPSSDFLDDQIKEIAKAMKPLIDSKQLEVKVINFKPFGQMTRTQNKAMLAFVEKQYEAYGVFVVKEMLGFGFERLREPIDETKSKAIEVRMPPKLLKSYLEILAREQILDLQGT